uniref:DeltaC n=1 Tax=Fundulus heteroclitus TaxID=8078 RepID=A0A3Q2PDI8_FUNHE
DEQNSVLVLVLVVLLFMEHRTDEFMVEQPSGNRDRGFCESPGRCKCHEGWEGNRCDTCKRHPGCLHGTCLQPWQCNCKEGWGGLYCDQGGSERAGRSGLPAPHGVSPPSCLQDLLNGYSCACPQGFYGTDCQISAMRCADGPCFNGGTCQECRDLGSRLVCRCRPGFTGPLCETNIDDCASNPCLNAGTCTDGVGGFSCTCTLGFSGKDCSVRSSPRRTLVTRCVSPSASACRH